MRSLNLILFLLLVSFIHRGNDISGIVCACEMTKMSVELFFKSHKCSVLIPFQCQKYLIIMIFRFVVYGSSLLSGRYTYIHGPALILISHASTSLLPTFFPFALHHIRSIKFIVELHIEKVKVGRIFDDSYSAVHFCTDTFSYKCTTKDRKKFL